MADVKRDAMLAQGLVSALPRGWGHLSSASLAYALVPAVAAALEATAGHMKHVPSDSISDGVWTGVRTLRQEAGRR